MPIWMLRAFAFVFGAVWGSFANVVIYRWPRELSVVKPGSHCTVCNKPVRAYDNVPILSWFILRGRCRDCGTKFSFRYPMIEVIFGVVSVAILDRIARGPESITVSVALAHYAVRFAVAFVLIVATFIDLDEMLVPWWVKWCAGVPLAAAALLRPIAPGVVLLDAVVGAGVGYVGLRLLFIDGYKLLTGRPGMGLGDAEILLLVGALVGIRGVLFALGAGAVQGVIATGLVKVFGGRLGPEAQDAEKSVAAPSTDGSGTDDASSARDDDSADEPEDDDLDEHGDDEHADDDDADADAATARGLKTKVPFVPFLALGALEYLLGADRLVEAYLRLLAS